jgi:hypothetical protein
MQNWNPRVQRERSRCHTFPQGVLLHNLIWEGREDVRGREKREEQRGENREERTAENREQKREEERRREEREEINSIPVQMRW